MATLQNVSSIIYNSSTNNLEVTYGATPVQQNYSVSSGQKLQMSRSGSEWDLEINSGEISTDNILMKFPTTHVSIDFGEEQSGGVWYYSIIVIGEDDIRDGLYSADNQFMVGMKSDPISVKVDSGLITIKKDFR